MGSSTDDFEKLTRLLRLKCYEQPPPRFFNEFPGQVLARLRSGQDAAEPESPLTRWFFRFGLSPVPAFACALIACGLVLYGVAHSLETGPSTAGTGEEPAAVFAGTAEPAGDLQPATLSRPQVEAANSSNPVMRVESFITPVRASFVPK